MKLDRASTYRRTNEFEVINKVRTCWCCVGCCVYSWRSDVPRILSPHGTSAVSIKPRMYGECVVRVRFASCAHQSRITRNRTGRNIYTHTYRSTKRAVRRYIGKLIYGTQSHTLHLRVWLSRKGSFGARALIL